MGFARRLPAPARLAAPPRAGDKPQPTGNSYFRTNGSCRLPPAHQGMDWVHWLMEGFRCRLCPPHPHPWLGTSPSPTFLFRPWAVVVGWGQAPALHFSFDPGDGGRCRRPAPEFIPDQSPGHAFLPMTRAGSGGIREKAAGTRQVGRASPRWGQAPALLETAIFVPIVDAGSRRHTKE